ncbi:hypothetical protein JRO89_XS03G0105100 [Xanthoceras sorbifolium]|uniref:Retrotransposon gag domain-containing protein n=1 Tax=Xanthoceras sorbifolium TaxID=99658 RepID=A0ABQ8I9F6_9ROSI|nr:hypothetical protein JRO89_XS03G0105100 [Xanthoceras sorbifolium]
MASQAPNEAVEHSSAPTRAQARRASGSNSSHHISSTHPYETSVVDHVTLASFHLEGDTQLWYHLLKHERIYVSWEELKQGLHSKFGTQVSCFISGLRDIIRTDVQANRPIDLTSAIACSSILKVGIQSQKTTTPTSPMLPFKKITPEELNERKRKGLCFRCNGKFGLGHQCKKLFLIQASFGNSDGDEDMEIEVDSEV